MSFSDNQITLQTNNDDHVGRYVIEARIYLEEWPSIEARQTFMVEIEQCRVTEIHYV